MNIMADLIVLGILIFALAFGGKKGFIKTIAGVIVTIVALIGATWLSGIVTQPITEYVFPKVQENILSKLAINAIDPTGMTIVDRAVENATGTVTDIMNVTAKAFVESIVHAAAFLVCFIVLKIVLQLLVGFADKVADLPLLNSVNTVLGAAFGLVEACLLLFLVPYVAKNLGIDWFERLSEGTFVLDFFVHSSPYDLIQLFLR
ncbi:MAG: CvpA family protein [Clostridia bacterium]|nr:CvpA family protein [Clostridia bacterium]